MAMQIHTLGGHFLKERILRELALHPNGGPADPVTVDWARVRAEQCIVNILQEPGLDSSDTGQVQVSCNIDGAYCTTRRDLGRFSADIHERLAEYLEILDILANKERYF